MDNNIYPWGLCFSLQGPRAEKVEDLCSGLLKYPASVCSTGSFRHPPGFTWMITLTRSKSDSMFSLYDKSVPTQKCGVHFLLGDNDTQTKTMTTAPPLATPDTTSETQADVYPGCGAAERRTCPLLTRTTHVAS